MPIDIHATIEASELVMTHVDNADATAPSTDPARWLELSRVAKEIRCIVAARLRAEAKTYLTRGDHHD